MKLALARAAIAGINAIPAAVPSARIVNVDPLCHVVPSVGDLARLGDAHTLNHESVFESWGMLSGRLHPELGGSRAHLDIVGVNYYWTHQWELGPNPVPLPGDDPRRVPLARLIRRAWKRYGGELLITETCHVHDMRPRWIDCIAAQCEQLLDEDVPLRGVCLYPILGMPGWHVPGARVHLGLWDILHDDPAHLRELCAPMWAALQQAQRLEERHANAILPDRSCA